jgi:hypothetical protein
MRSQQDIDMLKAAVDSKFVDVYAKSRGDVVEYYKEAYGSQWKSHLSMALSGTSDKSSRAYKSASRQFQFDKRKGKERYLGEKQTTATKARYEQAGKQIPPIKRKLPGDKLTVTVTGKQYDYSKRPGRSISVTFTGPDAYSFAYSPNYRDIWTEYKVDPDNFEEGSGELEVTSVT